VNQAYATRDAERARRLLDNLARRLEHQHPGAPASLREGLDKTLTVMRLALPDCLERGIVIDQSDWGPVQPGPRDRTTGAPMAKRHNGAALERRWVLEAEHSFR
jgi:hypothetical protein